MTDTDKAFVGSIPVLYDRHLVPMFFEPYAADLARRLGDLRAGRLLEIAAGTGAVTRALAQALPQSVGIVATDLNQPMLDLAASRLDERRVEWRQADSAALPFRDNEFDAVVCQFGVMFFPDKAAAFREAWRTLKPGGRLLFNVWDRIEDNEFTDVVSRAVAALFPEDPPLFFARTPHSYHAVGEIRAALESAGFRQIEVEAVESRSRAPSPRHAAIGLCQGTPLRNQIEERDASRLEEATEAAASALAERFGGGAIEGKMRALVVAATR
jgi:ubiquinone/menaquinone biosynthesis C-methylase UbiE